MSKLIHGFQTKQHVMSFVCRPLETKQSFQSEKTSMKLVTKETAQVLLSRQSQKASIQRQAC